MRRRNFIAMLGGAAVGLPLVARAQQPTMPVIGFLDGGSPDGMKAYLKAFRSGLAEIGYVEGQHLTIEYRWAQGRIDQLPALSADLVRWHVAVIVASRGT